MSLEDRVRVELLAIRKSADGLTVANLTRCPIVCGLLGNGDPHLAYNTLKYAILNADADTSLRAAMSSLALTSNQRTHLGRLDDFGAEHGYDQRHVRRYSDQGIRQLARLITTNWAVESVPCLDVYAYQVSTDSFAFAVETRRQHFIEMQSVRVLVYRGEEQPDVLDLPVIEHQEGIWQHSRLERIQLEVQDETSIAWVWRGELWPKFSVQWRTALSSFGISTESLGNKAMVRLVRMMLDH